MDSYAFTHLPWDSSHRESPCTRRADHLLCKPPTPFTPGSSDSAFASRAAPSCFGSHKGTHATKAIAILGRCLWLSLREPAAKIPFQGNFSGNPDSPARWYMGLFHLPVNCPPVLTRFTLLPGAFREVEKCATPFCRE